MRSYRNMILAKIAPRWQPYCPRERPQYSPSRRCGGTTTRITMSTFGPGILRHRSRWKGIQRQLTVPADGLPGNQTVSAIERKLGIFKATPAKKPADMPHGKKRGPFPNPEFQSMVSYYGPAGDEDALVRLVFPYPMRLYTRDAPADYRASRCHHRVRDSLLEVLHNLHDHFGDEGIRHHGLDVFGGIFNNRSVRGGRSKSKHAWGVAIDLNPAENANRQRWSPQNVGKPGWGNMPVDAVVIFEKAGWKHGGRAWGRDAMHFQATQ